MKSSLRGQNLEDKVDVKKDSFKNKVDVKKKKKDDISRIKCTLKRQLGE